MLDWLQPHISLTTLIWLFPITFLLHDFEEIIFVESWFKKNYVRLRPKVPNHMVKVFDDLSKTNAARFSIPVFMQFIVYIIASYLAAEQGFYGLFLGVNAVFFLHIFSHIGQSLYFGVYALGVGSAIIVTLPYSLYLFYRLMDEQIISFTDLAINLPYGLISVALVWFGHQLSVKILPDS
ncbi:HXXEE domain-containing protein [Niallia endozanthoxylica]|uniref:HXXEE domain-containing protein n=1 Tax=Niallia endozanthoxylica TaxID=2036016 RepID=A0A5J5HNN1_9BACI|nr:HXXEE domain-containing protein [Niallia endozanthoxylica]KAA9021044.1 HXXEE domain-containing protein [Niallia endozanthoxylica]